MNINLVVDIVQELKDFEMKELKSAPTVEDFRNFLNQKAYERETPSHLTTKYNLDVNDIENEIAKQIILLNRYAKILIKKALHDFPELVNEDFTYLYRLMDYDSLTKTQLVEKNAHEKQTGIEIIKRMAKNNLITEVPDENDKRSVRISVTEEGKKVFGESMKQITLASKIMCADFNHQEKNAFLQPVVLCLLFDSPLKQKQILEKNINNH